VPISLPKKQAAIDRIVTPEIKAQLDALEREFTETEKDPRLYD